LLGFLMVAEYIVMIWTYILHTLSWT
jgi:hypothetical protein